MKKQYTITIALASLFLFTCSGGKKQTLESVEAEKKVTIAPRDSLQRSKVVYNATEGITFEKINEPKTGNKTIGENLIKLDLTNAKIEEKEVNLDEFYTKVSYVKLKHPFVDNGLGFLGDANIHQYTRHEQGENSSSMRGFNSLVHLTKSNIVAGDKYSGYHVYSNTGDFLYTIASVDWLPEYDKVSNTISFYTNDVKTAINSFSVFENKALINVREDSISNTHVYDIERQKGIMAFRYMAPALIIKDNSFFAYNRRTNIKKGNDYLQISSYSQQDNSLSQTVFKSSNPEATTKGRRFGPESHEFVYYNNVLTTRQAYNDTIYRVKDINILEATYILNSGKMKLSNEDENSEHKEGKLIINNWLETDDFLFIMASVDQDFPNNRSENKVKFRYYYYNKKEGELYMKEGASIYPEEYTFVCNIDGAIPILASTAKQYGKKLYTSYTKSHLKGIIDGKNFKSYSSEQQDKIRSLNDDLPDGGLLIAIFE